MARNLKNREHFNTNKPNFWGFLQNVLITSMNKGQLIAMGFILIIILLILKYPSEQVPDLINKLFDISKVNKVLGWILSVVVTFSGLFIVRWQRRIHTQEVRRISREKKELQEKLIQQQLPSSNKTK